MMLEIPGALDAPTLAAVRAVAEQHDVFAPGRATAGWHARDRKHNLQAQPEGLVPGVLKKIRQAVWDHPLVQVAARPRDLVDVLLSRYDAGMSYGNHVDNAFMQGKRTDLSFTLFLSSPDDYDGGALVIDEPGGERDIKLEAGSLFLYPSSSLHRVEGVTRGSRLVAVGWLRSYLRHPYQREMLFDLERAIQHLRDDEAQDQALELLLKTRSNLMRLWAED